MLESTRELRAQKRDSCRILRDNHQVNHMCKHVELSHQANTVLSEYRESLEDKILTQGVDKDLW